MDNKSCRGDSLAVVAETLQAKLSYTSVLLYIFVNLCLILMLNYK